MRKMVIEGVEPQMVEVLRRMTPRQRLEVADGMWRSAREMLQRVLRDERPDWSDEQINRTVAARMAGDAS